jgi:hypothetical protein
MFKENRTEIRLALEGVSPHDGVWNWGSAHFNADVVLNDSRGVVAAGTGRVFSYFLDGDQVVEISLKGEAEVLGDVTATFTDIEAIGAAVQLPPPLQKDTAVQLPPQKDISLDAGDLSEWKKNMAEVVDDLRKGPGKAHRDNVEKLVSIVNDLTEDRSTWKAASDAIYEAAYKQRHYAWSMVRDLARWIEKKADPDASTVIKHGEVEAVAKDDIKKGDVVVENKDGTVSPVAPREEDDIPWGGNDEQDEEDDEQEESDFDPDDEPEVDEEDPFEPEPPPPAKPETKKVYTHVMWAQPDPNDGRISGYVESETKDGFILVDLDGTRIEVKKEHAKPPLTMVGADGETLAEMVSIYEDLCEAKDLMGSWKYIIAALSEAWKHKNIERDEAGRFLLRPDHMLEAFEKTLTDI